MFPEKKKDWSKGTAAEREEAGRNAREWGARNLYNHEKKKGNDPSFDSVQRYINERADIVDKQKERG